MQSKLKSLKSKRRLAWLFVFVIIFVVILFTKLSPLKTSNAVGSYANILSKNMGGNNISKVTELSIVRFGAGDYGYTIIETTTDMMYGGIPEKLNYSGKFQSEIVNHQWKFSNGDYAERGAYIVVPDFGWSEKPETITVDFLPNQGYSLTFQRNDNDKVTSDIIDPSKISNKGNLDKPINNSNNSLTKRFSLDGLKYKTIIELDFISTSKIKGFIEDVDEGTGTSSDSVNFTGIKNGDSLLIHFNGEKPIIGDNSKWTNNPWIIKNLNGVETLNIKFLAKNYDNNKWGNIMYQFLSSN